MKIHNPVGSKERFNEIFQGVNKVKLNENFGNESNGLLQDTFNKLIDGNIDIEQVNNNVNNGETVLEITGVDDIGNNASFTFKVTTNITDQDGVNTVDSAMLQYFRLDLTNEGTSIELPATDRSVAQLNANRQNDMINVVSEYVDFDSPEESIDDELYEEAIKLIDKVPYRKGSEEIQTHKSYADQKPTNPDIRVKSPQLDSFVKEDLDTSVETPETTTTRPLYPQAKEMDGDTQRMLRTVLWKDLGVELLNILVASSDEYRLIFRFEGAKYGVAINKNFNQVSDVVDEIRRNFLKNQNENINVSEEIEDEFPVDDEYTQDDEMEDIYKLPPEYMESPYDNMEDDEEEEKRYRSGGVSPRKAAIIGRAYENLMNAGNDRPSNADVQMEIKRIESKKTVSETNVENVDASTVIGKTYDKQVSPSMKTHFIKLADDRLTEFLGDERNNMPSRDYLDKVYKLAKAKFAEYIADERMNETEKSEYPDQIGTKFKPKNQMPKKKKKPQSVVKLSESTDTDRYEDVIFLEGHEAIEPLEILNNQGEDAALNYLMQWHDAGSHMGSSELGHGSNDRTYEKDGYIMSWNTDIGYIGLAYDLSQMNENDDEILAGTNTTEPDDEDIEQVIVDKEEVGDEITGGKADDKSPQDFCPKQLAMGLQIEMEHTDDPMVALEIAMDHLTEIPDYYTRLDKMEAEAGVDDGEKSEDDEITDELLGYKSHNVGDYADTNELDITEGFGKHVVVFDGTSAYVTSEDDVPEDAELKGKFNNIDDANALADEINGETGNFVSEEQEDVFKTLGDILRPENGDRYKDAENKQFTVKNTDDDSVTLQGQSGDNEVPIPDLQHLKKVNENKTTKKQVITEAQIQIARQALNKRGVTTMTKKEAVLLLIKNNLK